MKPFPTTKLLFIGGVQFCVPPVQAESIQSFDAESRGGTPTPILGIRHIPGEPYRSLPS